MENQNLINLYGGYYLCFWNGGGQKMCKYNLK